MLTSFIFEVPRGTPWDGSARFKAQMNAKRDIIRGEAQYEDLVLDSNKPGRLDQRLFVRDRLKRLHDSRGSYEIPFAKRRTVDGVSRPMSLQEYAEQGYDTVQKMNYAMTRLPLLSGSGEVGIDSRFFDTEKYHPERIRGIYNALFTSESGAAAGRGNIMQSLSQFWRLRQQLTSQEARNSFHAMAAKILRGAPLQGVLDSRNPTADALQEMANTSSGPYVGGGGAPQASQAATAAASTAAAQGAAQATAQAQARLEEQARANIAMPGARRAVPSAHRPVPPVPAFPAEERKWGSDDGGDNDGYRETFPQLRLQLGDDSVSSVDDYQDAHSQMGNDSFDLPLLQPEARQHPPNENLFAGMGPLFEDDPPAAAAADVTNNEEDDDDEIIDVRPRPPAPAPVEEQKEEEEEEQQQQQEEGEGAMGAAAEVSEIEEEEKVPLHNPRDDLNVWQGQAVEAQMQHEFPAHNQNILAQLGAAQFEQLIPDMEFGEDEDMGGYLSQTMADAAESSVLGIESDDDQIKEPVKGGNNPLFKFTTSGLGTRPINDDLVSSVRAPSKHTLSFGFQSLVPNATARLAMYNPTIFGVMGAKTVSKIENGTFDVVGALRASNIVGFLPLLSAFLENSPNRDIALSKSKQSAWLSKVASDSSKQTTFMAHLYGRPYDPILSIAVARGEQYSRVLEQLKSNDKDYLKTAVMQIFSEAQKNADRICGSLRRAAIMHENAEHQLKEGTYVTADYRKNPQIAYMNHPNLSKIYGRYLSREAINSMLDHEGNNAKANPFKHVGTLWGLDKAAKDAPVEQIVTKRAAQLERQYNVQRALYKMVSGKGPQEGVKKKFINEGFGLDEFTLLKSGPSQEAREILYSPMFDGIASPLYEIIREPIVSFPHRNALLYDNPSLGGLLDLVAHFKNESYAHPGGVFHILETPQDLQTMLLILAGDTKNKVLRAQANYYVSEFLLDLNTPVAQSIFTMVQKQLGTPQLLNKYLSQIHKDDKMMSKLWNNYSLFQQAAVNVHDPNKLAEQHTAYKQGIQEEEEEKKSPEQILESPIRQRISPEQLKERLVAPIQLPASGVVEQLDMSGQINRAHQQLQQQVQQKELYQMQQEQIQVRQVAAQQEMHQLEEEIKEDLDQESDWARFAADRDIELSTKEEKARELQTLIGRTQDLLKNERLREQLKLGPIYYVLPREGQVEGNVRWSTADRGTQQNPAPQVQSASLAQGNLQLPSMATYAKVVSKTEEPIALVDSLMKQIMGKYAIGVKPPDQLKAANYTNVAIQVLSDVKFGQLTYTIGEIESNVKLKENEKFKGLQNTLHTMRTLLQYLNAEIPQTLSKYHETGYGAEVAIRKNSELRRAIFAYLYMHNSLADIFEVGTLSGKSRRSTLSTKLTKQMGTVFGRDFGIDALKIAQLNYAQQALQDGLKILNYAIS